MPHSGALADIFPHWARGTNQLTNHAVSSHDTVCDMFVMAPILYLSVVCSSPRWFWQSYEQRAVLRAQPAGPSMGCNQNQESPHPPRSCLCYNCVQLAALLSLSITLHWARAVDQLCQLQALSTMRSRADGGVRLPPSS